MKNNKFNIRSTNEKLSYYYLLIRRYASIFNYYIDNIDDIVNLTGVSQNLILDNDLEIFNKIDFTYIPIVMFIKYKVIELQKMNINAKIIQDIEADMITYLMAFIIKYEQISITVSNLIDVLFKYSSLKYKIEVKIKFDDELYYKVVSFL